jgi:hypothetical protein
VGWIRYGIESALIGSTVEQRNGELFLQQGNLAGLLGAVIVETNGIPIIFPDNFDTTKILLLKDNYSHPNQVLSFKFRYLRWRDLGDSTTSFMLVSTRLNMTNPNERIPDADPIQEAGYALVFFPITHSVLLGKYEGQLAVIAPGYEGWTIFAEIPYPFDREVDYRVKFYLKEGDLKVKIWEGEPADEPVEWLIAVTDSTPRVSGKFTAFGIIGSVPQAGDDGDQLVLDDINVYGFGGTGVTDQPETASSENFWLAPNYPNPFNPNTQITFFLPEQNWTQVQIFNTQGQVMRTLLNCELAAGARSIAWNGRNDQNQAVPSGIYLYRLTSGEYTQSHRMLLLR